MAGDWIKLQHATLDKPEVLRIAKILGMSAEAAFGHIARVWVWADQQSLDGHAIDVTHNDIDAISRHAGVATAMREVGWLTGQEGAISFPNFTRHNGESAKKRALAADRKREERSRNKRDENVTRGEKRRVLKPLGDHSPGRSTANPQWWATQDATLARAKELGLSTRGESWDALKAAIRDKEAKAA